jgi:ArsR family transcriptional regulator, lead/cadmium/zinc/bismuth-responsive transcriptional repressor
MTPTLSTLKHSQIVELGQMFALMSDPSRLKIILACLNQPICVSDIADKTELSPSLVSHHLRLLRTGRILKAERQGKQIFYSSADEHIHCVISDMIRHVKET